MSIFKKIRNFLGKDEVRAGLAIGSGLAGMGAFDGMKYGGALTTGLGGLNVASGLSAGGVSGALQAGLGGYGLAQGLGKVGTFQDTYSSIFGGGKNKGYSSVVDGRSPEFGGLPMQSTSISGPQSFTDQVQSYNFANRSSIPNYAYESQRNLNIAGDLDAMRQGGMSDADIQQYLKESPRQFGGGFQPQFGVQNTNTNATQFANVSGAVNTGGSVPSGSRGSGQFNPPNVVPNQSTPNMSNADILTANQSAVGTGGGANMSTPGGSIFSGAGNQMAANSNQVMVTAGGKSVPSFMVNGQQVVIGENGLMQPAADWVRQNTEGSGFSFKGVMDNIAQKAMDDPMQALSVGSALITAFAESPQEQAARLYAEEVARVRAQTDPNSDFGQNFMSEYTTQRQNELNQQYADAKANWVSSMAARGLTNSTIATEGIASLDAKFAEIQSKLPMDAMQALQQYQNNQFKNLNLGLGPATNQAKLMAGQSNPFSLASKGAVASVGS
ncbi:MAG: hypothetical protein CL970_00015 [Euryarchaeota archaeon]|nr:hypothetical protein [Euryarchaeota archaeon]|tara:strand:+ start:1857 stop:3350 length:1494 start_codon:yes stop_codon:yes gene_type:complete